MDNYKVQKTTYYRLVQTDFDGTSEIFRPVALKSEDISNNSLNIYPNPVANNENLFINADGLIVSGYVIVKIIDYQGRIIENYEFITDYSGSLNEVVSSDKLIKGIYFVTIADKNTLHTRKLMVR